MTVGASSDFISSGVSWMVRNCRHLSSPGTSSLKQNRSWRRCYSQMSWSSPRSRWNLWEIWRWWCLSFKG